MKLQIEGLTKAFSGNGKEGLLALDKVDLQVLSGEFLSIAGPSGCGKSTLLEIIAGLQEKTDGEIYIEGVPLEKTSSNCAIVFQHYGLFPWLTVQKNVEYGLKIRGIGKQERGKISCRLIERVRLTGFEKYYPHELSGGMQQRVALARALAYEPDILLLDEPFAALDTQTRENCQKELLALWQDTGVTIVFVTHDVGEAIFLSDRVVVMSGTPGTVREILDIDLPRPRDLEVRGEPAFWAMESHVRKLISNNDRPH